MDIQMTYKCYECGQPCDFTVVDYGVGRHEYWGAQANDVDLCVVSKCCDAIVLDHNDNTVTVQTLKEQNHDK